MLLAEKRFSNGLILTNQWKTAKSHCFQGYPKALGSHSFSKVCYFWTQEDSKTPTFFNQEISCGNSQQETSGVLMASGMGYLLVQEPPHNATPTTLQATLCGFSFCFGLLYFCLDNNSIWYCSSATYLSLLQHWLIWVSGTRQMMTAHKMSLSCGCRWVESSLCCIWRTTNMSRTTHPCTWPIGVESDAGIRPTNP